MSNPDTKNIVLKTNDKDVEKVNKLLRLLKDIDAKYFLGNLNYGRLGSFIFISFTIHKSLYHQLLEILKYNNILIISDQKILNEIKENEFDKREHSTKPSTGFENWKSEETEGLNVNKLVNDGEYDKLMRIIKNIHLSKAIVDEVKKRIQSAISNAIKLAFEEGVEKSHLLNASINKLLDISSDTILSSHEYNQHTKEAGMRAVSLASINDENYNALINICNNNKVNKTACVSAAINFASLTLQNPEVFEDYLEYAKKKLNLQWLLICYTMVEHEFRDQEKKYFDMLVDYINNH